MQTSTFKNYRCWQPERVSQVINTEAVAVDKATFLATHSQFSYIKYLKAPHELPRTDEESLLQELLHRGREDQHSFVVLQGAPGTGKSHLIRWLKERYEAQNRQAGLHDVILLIERAQCNLRNTLEQIIRAGLFDDPAMSNHLKRLEGAASTLSSAGLADTILNNLQVAAKELGQRDDDPTNARIKRNVEYFLLDTNIRRFLQVPNGPVQRVMNFLSSNNQTGAATEELPEFQQTDFNIPLSVLNNMRTEAYRGALDLAEDLRSREKLRLEMAHYLNGLLRYAIGRTIAISSSDLVEMFADLRRHLRRRNRQLALFIEDIAALSGLDNGLIDALVTQHTSEANTQLCRLTSIVGITDYYFDRRIPDNIRDRITYHLTLNIEAGDGRQSQLLSDPQAIVDLASRYLNAIRLSEIDLQTWLSNGGHAADMPNACAGCRFRSSCHAAFGGVDLAAHNSRGASIGLYPFNLLSLTTMYSNLAPDSRTPRGLLRAVLAYVLHNAGSLYDIEAGLFPPPPDKVGSEFAAPQLVAQPQRNTIQNQAGADARRVESLVLFWGDRSVYSTTYADQRRVGGLVEQAFKAFGLPFIEGEPSVQAGEEEAPAIDRQDPVAVVVVAPEATAQRTSEIPTVLVPVPQARTKAEKYNNAITQWQNGAKLQYYEDFAGWLVSLVQNYIDWEAYDIHPALVRERVMPGRFIIEDQAGKIAGQDHIVFARSPMFANVLYALADLSQHGKQLPDNPTLTAHLIAVTNWLHTEQDRIAEFVCKPSATAEPPALLLDLLIADCVFIEALAGKLDPDQHSDKAILTVLIDAAVKLLPWAQQVASLENIRSQSWVGLMRTLNQYSRVDSCRKALLVSLNRAQGDIMSALNRTPNDVKVRFINAAAALDALARLREQDWKLPPLPSIQSSVSVWVDAAETYGVVQNRLHSAVDGEFTRFVQVRGQLERLLGDNSPEQVFSAIDDVLTDLSLSKHLHSFHQQPGLSARELATLLSQLHTLTAEKDYVLRVLRLSGGLALAKRLGDYSSYLLSFESMLQGQSERLAAEIAKERAVSMAAATRQRIEETYDSLLALLKA